VPDKMSKKEKDRAIKRVFEKAEVLLKEHFQEAKIPEMLGI